VFTKVSLDDIFSTSPSAKPEKLEMAAASEAANSNDIITEELKMPEELQNVTLEPDSFESIEEAKLEGLEVFDGCIVNREMEELLQELISSSFKKDRVFDNNSHSSQVSKSWELMDEQFFLDYESLEDDIIETNSLYLS